jgi:hypothetical protein
MATRRLDGLTIPAAAVLLLWPAIWNRYPIVFADTGTYLSQAIHRYAGWDRPVFYSLFIFPLHAMHWLWPIVVVQALLTAWLLRRVCDLAAPGLDSRGFLLLIAGLSLGTWLPWLVSEVMPDLFTPLLVLALWALAWPPGRLALRETAVFAGLASFMIATQQSSLPLSVAVIAAAVVLGWEDPSPVVRWVGRAGGRDRKTLSWPGVSGPPVQPPDFAQVAPTRRAMTGGTVARPAQALACLLPPVIAVLALCSVNVAAHGRFAVSPFGNVFLLARVLYDGPGMAVLQRDCPGAGWRLCAYRDRMPDSSDDFLWTGNSPLHLAGGPKQISAEASAIIDAGLRADPLGLARAALGNTAAQLASFASGDGLNAWPAQVTPKIAADFPAAETARYAAARQQQGTLEVPAPLAHLHRIAALIGVAGCLLLLPGAWRRRHPAAGLLIVVLVSLPVGAAVTGALSGPHDRYQARLMWLPPFAASLALATRGRRDA